MTPRTATFQAFVGVLVSGRALSGTEGAGAGLSEDTGTGWGDENMAW